MAYAQFQFRRDTAANWTAADPVLAEGEIGLELDTDQFKIGDGVTVWSALSYGGIQGPQGIQGIQGQTGLTGETGSVSSASTLTLTHTTTPSDPGAGNTAVYAKSDGKLYVLPAGGSETEVGAGASAYADLTDVDTTGLAVGQAMVWNGTFWVPGSAGGGREVLTANRTYYVRTDGSDSNDGLTDTAGGAFLTIQKAVDVVASLDISIYDVTIRIQAGTWTSSIVCKSPVGSGLVTVRGANDDNTSTIISTTSASCFTGKFTGRFKIEFLKLQTTTTGSCIRCSGALEIGNVNFGSCAETHIALSDSSCIFEIVADYTISGGANGHIFALRGGYILCTGRTITITGTPAFAAQFLWSAYCAQALVYSNTFSGSATGQRHSATLNGVIFTGGQTLPGSVAGSVATGGQYA